MARPKTCCRAPNDGDGHAGHCFGIEDFSWRLRDGCAQDLCESIFVVFAGAVNMCIVSVEK